MNVLLLGRARVCAGRLDYSCTRVLATHLRLSRERHLLQLTGLSLHFSLHGGHGAGCDGALNARN